MGDDVGLREERKRERERERERRDLSTRSVMLGLSPAAFTLRRLTCNRCSPLYPALSLTLTLATHTARLSWLSILSLNSSHTFTQLCVLLVSTSCPARMYPSKRQPSLQRASPRANKWLHRRLNIGVPNSVSRLSKTALLQFVQTKGSLPKPCCALQVSTAARSTQLSCAVKHSKQLLCGPLLPAALWPP
eukprot:355917-Chlamydomonas_euryale.AAC.2